MDVEQSEVYFKTAFNIQSEVFSGPLDLLINLIEKRKFLINDISLAAVTDDYMAYVARFETNPLHDMADFIVLASTLLLLKSKSLLPVLELTEAEEESLDILEKRLKHYQIFRNASRTISSCFGAKMSFEKQFVVNTEPLFVPDKYSNVFELRNAMDSVLTHLPKKIKKPKVEVRKVISLESMIDKLKERVERQFQFNFHEFAKEEKERSTVIVGFLAVLELVKQGSLLVRQTTRFHEIHIERRQSTAPRYQ